MAEEWRLTWRKMVKKWPKSHFGVRFSISAAICRPFQAWGHFPFPISRGFCAGQVSHSVNVRGRFPGRMKFSRIFIFGPADFFANFLAGFFLLIFVGKSAQKNPPGKSPAKSSKIYTTRIPDSFLQRGRANKWPVPSPRRSKFPRNFTAVSTADFSGHVRPWHGTAICNFGAPSPLDLFEFSPVDISPFFSRFSV